MSSSSESESLRHHPELAALFKAAESRHLTDQELDEYYRVCPDELERVSAAREIAAFEQSLVQKVVSEIYLVYPYEQNHQMASPKCIRDVRYVVAYASMAMLMKDPQWFEDKLLIWLKTILQAFEFPERNQQKKVLFGSVTPDEDNREKNMKPKQRSIYETYTKLKQYYRNSLNATSFNLFEPYLQQAIDVLSADY
jgi:hypothetical protein